MRRSMADGGNSPQCQSWAATMAVCHDEGGGDGGGGGGVVTQAVNCDITLEGQITI